MRRHRPDMVLLGSILALLTVGFVMVYSSSAVRGYILFDDPYHFLKMEVLWIILGLGAIYDRRRFAQRVRWVLLCLCGGPSMGMFSAWTLSCERSRLFAGRSGENITKRRG